MIYFISGHRNVTQEEFDKYYKPRLDYIFLTNRSPVFVVAECEGVDQMAQDYLAERAARCSVTVFHMFDAPRYLASDLFRTKGGYKSDIERDSAMTCLSDIDIAFIRDPKIDSGTRQNILRRYVMK